MNCVAVEGARGLRSIFENNSKMFETTSTANYSQCKNLGKQ